MTHSILQSIDFYLFSKCLDISCFSSYIYTWSQLSSMAKYSPLEFLVNRTKETICRKGTEWTSSIIELKPVIACLDHRSTACKSLAVILPCHQDDELMCLQFWTISSRKSFRKKNANFYLTKQRRCKKEGWIQVIQAKELNARERGNGMDVVTVFKI